MTNNYRYLQEMAESGYNANKIDDFHYFCLPYLAKRFFPSKDVTILDIGVGWGHCLIPLKAVGYSNLIAIDCSSSQNRFEQEEIRFLRLDIETEKLPFQDSTIDGVISFHLIEHLENSTNFMSEAFRVLRVGGYLITVTPDWRKQYKTFWRDHTHIHPYDKESIARIFRCFGFTIVWIRSFGCMRGI